MQSCMRINSLASTDTTCLRVKPLACAHAFVATDRRAAGSCGRVVKASAQAAQTAQSWDNVPRSVGAHINAFHRFTRPHTVLGTLVSVTSVSLMALKGQAWTASACVGFVYALIAALAANVSIVGINQCFDIEVDRINKPYLPLASGEWSAQTGWLISLFMGAVALVTAAASASWPLVITVAGSILLGFAYSVQLPFLRWKQFPLVAAGCIITVRSLLVQFGFWAHMHIATGASDVPVTPNLIFMVSFLAFFSIVIALFKDIPDVRGDENCNIRTASVRFGVPKIFWTCVWLLYAAYGSAVAYIMNTMTGMERLMLIGAQLCMAGLLRQRALLTDLSRNESIVGMYMFIWKLFYAQYLLFPFLA